MASLAKQQPKIIRNLIFCNKKPNKILEINRLKRKKKNEFKKPHSNHNHHSKVRGRLLTTVNRQEHNVKNSDPIACIQLQWQSLQNSHQKSSPIMHSTLSIKKEVTDLMDIASHECYY